jgi:hypothetical protein
MVATRAVVVSLFAVLAWTAPAAAQPPRQVQPRSPAFEQGYARGSEAGQLDRRRNRPFSYADELEYRRGDAGYRGEYGPRDWYRDEFQRGYRLGYQDGYEGRRVYGRSTPGYTPGWSNGRGRARGRAGGAPPPWLNGRDGYRLGPQVDLSYENGFLDGYDAGLDDGADRRQFNPIGERRYRSADHRYDRRYGPKELYRNRYRDAFRQGYQAGYDDGRRYGNGRPWWWPW